MPPPYPEFIHNGNPEDPRNPETQALLPPRRNSIESSSDSISGSRFDDTELKIGLATFFAVAAGISFSGCRLLMQNVKMNAIEVTIVGSLVQVRIFSEKNINK